MLQVYTRNNDPRYPVICFDESPKQLVSEVIKPLPIQPGQKQRFDYLYQREGVCNVLMFFDPFNSWRHVEVTERRTAIDYAQQMKRLVDEYYPNAITLTVVQDQLNTHTPASLYKAFAPAEARRILEKLDFHYTPKHGSWLNMAEIELSILSRQCLDCRIPDQPTLQREVTAWEQRRNRSKHTIDPTFRTVLSTANNISGRLSLRIRESKDECHSD